MRIQTQIHADDLPLSHSQTQVRTVAGTGWNHNQTLVRKAR
jgi:hypothetical protein